MGRQIEQYLITGAAGQLGRELAAQFAEEETLLKTREMLDVTDFQKVQRDIKTLSPDVVIHCAGITNAVLAEKGREAAWRVNVSGTDNLVKTCALHGVPLICISSAHVFGMDSQRRKPLAETDPAAPTNWLGVTHLGAEQSVLGLGQCMNPEYWNRKFRYWVLRVAEPYGRPMRPANCFAHSVMRRLDACTKRKQIGLAQDVERSFTYLPDLAKAVVWLTRNRLEVVSGVYHVANKGVATPFAFGQVVARHHRRSGGVSPSSIEADFDQSVIGTDKIARYTGLNTDKWHEIAPFPMRSWQEAADEFAREWGV